ncbi:hypothetical protein N7535_005384 [Penicillium sp. DV-2018c]|nr:hypothetical protein N7535_005384 [Penicillium sp. DV-2018c]
MEVDGVPSQKGGLSIQPPHMTCTQLYPIYPTTRIAAQSTNLTKSMTNIPTQQLPTGNQFQALITRCENDPVGSNPQSSRP